jgi:hypothetical protein
MNWYKAIKLAFTDSQDVANEGAEIPSPLQPGDDSEVPTRKTWNRKKKYPKRLIYQLGVEVPVYKPKYDPQTNTH